MMRTSPPAAKQRDEQSAWAPLANPMFRALWVAAMAATHLSVPGRPCKSRQPDWRSAYSPPGGSSWSNWKGAISRLPCIGPRRSWTKNRHLTEGLCWSPLAYPVDPAHLSAFLSLMEQQRVARRRDGALYWQLFQDSAASGRYLETFLAESWLEHLRHHERVTLADRLLQDQILHCLAGAAQPAVTHYLAVTMPGEGRKGGSS